MQLKQGTKLQGGKFVILKTLGQGGFGITYLAEQVALKRSVAIKEFFMKDCCERNNESSHVGIPTQSNRELVDKFRGKFVREAQMMASLDHPNIVRVTDVFEENGTAYYVMENLPGGSLADKIKKDGPLSESLAEQYIRQVADALAYIHSRNTVHLDVKPGNVLLNTKGDAVLIDFGISKHYDQAGEQTSSTPVGLSKGYAPLEQGRDGDVSQFQPSTDIYALGATLFYLVTGTVPPEASIVNEEGLVRPEGITDRIWGVIQCAMQPKRHDRPQSITEFLSLLDSPQTVAKDDEHTNVNTVPKPGLEQEKKGKPRVWLWAVLAVIIVMVIYLALSPVFHKPYDRTSMMQEEATLETNQRPEEALNLTLADESISIAFGSLKVASTPSGASIWLDGKDTKKTTPEVLENLSPGQHSIKLILKDYQDFSSRVTVSSSKREDLSIKLKAKEISNQQIGQESDIKPSPSDVDNETHIELSKNKYELEVGETRTLTATVSPKNSERTITWISLDEQIVTISKMGTITAQKAGIATIIARCGNQEASCEVTVKDKPTKVQDVVQAPVQAQSQQQQTASDAATGTVNGHDWVDLGLSVKWATCNVGASTPSDYGNYYAWGETSTKSEYYWATLKYCTNSEGPYFNKYCLSKKNWSGEGKPDKLKRLEMSDDAARINWGGTWRMPTEEECKELVEKCSWKWSTQNGKKGYIVTGANGRSVFLPAAGWWNHDSVHASGIFGGIWSSSLSDVSSWAVKLYFEDEATYGEYEKYSVKGYMNKRYEGWSIRPVIE